MEHLLRGQKINLLGHEGVVFSSNEKQTQVYINGDLKTISTSNPDLKILKDHLPTAAEIVLEDNSGVGGNAFFIMGRVENIAKKFTSEEEISNYREKATSGDYEFLLETSIKFLQNLGFK